MRQPMPTLFALLAILFQTGCDLVDPKAPPLLSQSYGWGFINVSDSDLDEVNLYMERSGRDVLVGFAGSLMHVRYPSDGGKCAITKDSPQRIPESVFVSWSTKDGKTCRETVSLAGIVPNMADFHGTIWLRFDGTGWKPIPLSTEETNLRVTHGMNMAPTETPPKQ